MGIGSKLVFASGIIWLYQNAAFSGNPFFPETKNWRLSVDEIVYTPDNLYELIDGAADAYIAYFCGFAYRGIHQCHKRDGQN